MKSIGEESKFEGIAYEVWKKFVDEKRSSSTLEGGDECETPRQKVNYEYGRTRFYREK